MLEDPLGIEDADLAEVVRLAGILTLVLVVLGPATTLAAVGVPAPTASDLWVVAMAFGPGALAGVATGIGYLRVPPAERARTWPARFAALASLLLPAALAAYALAQARPGL